MVETRGCKIEGVRRESGLVFVGGDSRSEGRVFESQHRIVIKIVMRTNLGQKRVLIPSNPPPPHSCVINFAKNNLKWIFGIELKVD